MDPKNHIERADQAKAARAIRHAIWDDCARYFSPWDVGFTGKYKPGERIFENVRDSASRNAVTRFIAIMHQGMTPRNTLWHGYDIASDPELIEFQPVREHIDLLTKYVFANRYAAGAGFDTSMKLSYRSEGVFGTSIIFKETVPGGLRYRYTPVPLRECFPETDYFGQPAAMHRIFERTAGQISEQWPQAAKKGKISQALERNRQERFTIQHSVVKRADYDPRKRDRMNKPWASVYLLRDDKTVLSEGGFDHFPYIVGRLEPDGVEPYGTGLGEIAIADSRELNQMVATTTRAGMKQVDPNVLTTPEFEEEINLNPGAVIPGGLDHRGRPQIQEMAFRGNALLGLELQNQRRNSIDDTWGNSIFQLLRQFPQMTATEVQARVRQSNALIAPFIGQQETDKFGPLIAWETQIAIESGDLPPPPRELEGHQIVPAYSSPLLKVVRADEAENIARALEFVVAMASQGLDSALDIIDPSEAMRAFLDGNNVPARVINSRAKVRDIATAREAAQQQEQQAQQLGQVAEAAGAASPALAAIANIRNGGGVDGV